MTLTTIDTMCDTQRGLLDAILDNPDDDNLRLIYADWLEENERMDQNCPHCRVPEFEDGFDPPCMKCRGTRSVSNGFARCAEFIRVQLDLAKEQVGLCEEPILYGGHYPEPCRMCDGCKQYVTLGKKETSLWGSWPDKNNVRSIMHASLPDLEGGWVVLPTSYLMHGSRWAKVNRGFVEQIAAPFDTHIAHLRDIVRRHPVIPHSSMVTNKVPLDVTDGFIWRPGYYDFLSPNHLPISVFNLLDNYTDSLWVSGGMTCKHYTTSKDAMLALANALLMWAKS
jgi:uncharacterized protein (TIGR02996 family)